MVLGAAAAGAGKSTYLNRVFGAEVSTVSHSTSEDGTVEVRSFACGESVVTIDTPGLDSMKALTTGPKIITALEQAGVDGVVSILVVRKDLDRIITVMDRQNF